MRRSLLILSGVLVLALLAAGLTEVSLAIGHRGLIADDLASRSASPTPLVTAEPTAAPTPTAVPAASPTSIPVVTPAARTATTNGFVHLRSGASTATAIVTDLNGGTVVVLGNYVDAQWQEVTVNGVHGYIYRDYLAY